MKSEEIRQGFIDFFTEKGHEKIKSSSLIPVKDPTLLFTNAGMVQFKSIFIGQEKSSYKRAVSCQKCMRAGGKHNDLDNIGYTARHHSFFEMLGNFSFGEYFKREAIEFAWELLTVTYGLPKDRLWVTIFESDDEAEKLWFDHSDVNKDMIVRLGADDNFWQMGDTGPCGPCSEIIIDQGPDIGCKRPGCTVGCDCDRYLELWNLVFMQYDKKEDGTLEPLPSPSIDTGMGLERVSAVLQNKYNNFDTDIFSNIINEITRKTNKPYKENSTVEDDPVSTSIRVIADHIRAITFLLCDGLTPSNEGRGYVLRRVIRRAARHGRSLNMSESFLHTLVEPCVDSYVSIYPEIGKDTEILKKTLLFEEERFAKTLDNGLELLEKLIKEALESKVKELPGGEIFQLYDTYGFPPDIARDVAREKGLVIDEKGFQQKMDSQRQRGKNSWGSNDGSKKTSSIADSINFNVSFTGETVFNGYEYLESTGQIKYIILDGNKVGSIDANKVKKGQQCHIILDNTPFYAESGGQVGDVGQIFTDDSIGLVLDTKKIGENIYLHAIDMQRGTISKNEKVHCKVDPLKRYATMRNHTATHMLHSALRNVLGEHVKQGGSLVGPERLRFDFTHFTQVSQNELQLIEDMVNSKILENLEVKTHKMTLDEAVDFGAIALFDEKYGEKVRVVEIDGYSKELCGGTHLSQTGQIGSFYLLSESSIASGVRRIEAVTGLAAIDEYRKQSAELNKIGAILKTDNRVERIEAIVKQLKGAEKELERLRQKDMASDIKSIVENSKTDVNGTDVLSIRKDDLAQKELRDFSDIIKDNIGSGVILVASVTGDAANFILIVTKDLTEKFDAGKLMKEIALLTGGRGGGKSTMAQGGTKETGKVDEVIKNFAKMVKDNT